MKEIRISTFNHLNVKRTKNFDEILTVVPEKFEHLIVQKMWSPSTFRLIDGKIVRSSRNWEGCSLLSYDIDQDMSLEEAIKKFENFNCIIATTKSHQKQKGTKPPVDRFRLIFFLNEHIYDKNIYISVWRNFIQKHQIPADKSCKDLARFYFPSKEIVFRGKGKEIYLNDYLQEQTSKTATDKDGDKGEIPVGKRHTYLVEQFGRLRGQGFSPLEIEERLHEVNQRQCAPPLEAQEVQKITKSFPQRSFEEVAIFAPHTDLGNAERFKSLFEGEVVYAEKLQKWFVYDGTRYQEDTGALMLQKAKYLLRKCQNLIKEKALAESDQLIKHLKRSESLNRIKSMLFLAQAELPVNPINFDANLFHLNLSNGTLDLKSGELRPHSRDDLITKKVGVAYNQNANCPLFKNFLKEITCGNQELERYLQVLTGYCLTGDTREQILFIYFGNGSNGKSTFIELQKELYGDYCKTADISTFTYKKSEQVRNDLARLFDTRVVSSVEIQEGKLLDESVVKQVTGGDPVTSRFLFREHFEYVPKWKLLMVVNHLPHINGTDKGIWRRIKVIPFNATFEGKIRDKSLLEKLKQELPGILNWAIEGCLRWQREGLVEPEIIKSASELYRIDEDLIGDFINEYLCPATPSTMLSVSEVYGLYASLQKDFGQRVMSQKLFSQKMFMKGFERHRGAGGRIYYRGYQIRPQK